MADPATAHRALRAFAKLHDANVAAWLRPLCHAIVQGDWSTALASEHLPLTSSLDTLQEWRLQHSALEALRDIGDQSSIEVLRMVRVTLENILSQLSFQVAEEIYWHYTGGLTKETFER